MWGLEGKNLEKPGSAAPPSAAFPPLLPGPWEAALPLLPKLPPDSCRSRNRDQRPRALCVFCCGNCETISCSPTHDTFLGVGFASEGQRPTANGVKKGKIQNHNQKNKSKCNATKKEMYVFIKMSAYVSIRSTNVLPGKDETYLNCGETETETQFPNSNASSESNSTHHSHCDQVFSRCSGTVS